MTLVLRVCAASLAVGCGGISDPEQMLAPDPERTGLGGADGPYGVARVDVRAPSRVTGTVPVQIFYPADGSLAPAVSGAPAVILHHGGLVEPERYEWLAVHLASRGQAVALPEADLGLALLEPGNGEIALSVLRGAAEEGEPLDGLVQQDGPYAVSGHSLGGVVAARQWLRAEEASGLVMLASFPARSDSVEDSSRPALVLGGSNDGALERADLVSEAERFGRAFVGVVTGMNHYAWTDTPTEGELSRDGPLAGELADLRKTAQSAMDLYLDGVFGGDLGALDAPIAGIEWER